jgi:hypothetical protein
VFSQEALPLRHREPGCSLHSRPPAGWHAYVRVSMYGVLVAGPLPAYLRVSMPPDRIGFDRALREPNLITQLSDVKGLVTISAAGNEPTGGLAVRSAWQGPTAGEPRGPGSAVRPGHSWGVACTLRQSRGPMHPHASGVSRAASESPSTEEPGQCRRPGRSLFREPSPVAFGSDPRRCDLDERGS